MSYCFNLLLLAHRLLFHLDVNTLIHTSYALYLLTLGLLAGKGCKRGNWVGDSIYIQLWHSGKYISNVKWNVFSDEDFLIEPYAVN